MSITNAQYTLSNVTPTEIVSPSVMPQLVVIHNLTKSNNHYIYYGNSTVTTTNAPHIDPGETVQFRLLPLETLFAVSDPNGLPVGVMVQKQG